MENEEKVEGNDIGNRNGMIVCKTFLVKNKMFKSESGGYMSIYTCERGLPTLNQM